MKRMILFCISFIYISVILLSGVAGAAQAEKPLRVVSMAPSLTESLCELGALDSLAGVTTWCVKPAEAAKKEKIGTLLEFNTERIVMLKPDLVLAMEFTDGKTLEKLERMGLRVEKFPSPRDFEDLCFSFLRLGRLVGREAEAKRIADQAKREVLEMRARVRNTPRLRIFWQLGAKPLFSATRGHFTNDFITFVNGENIAGEARRGVFSREEVIVRKPDVIIIVTMGLAEKEEKEAWNVYDSIPAVKNRRIYIVDANLYCSPTPSGFARGLRELVKLLRPGLKE